jgi:hypothetical protein
LIDTEPSSIFLEICAGLKETSDGNLVVSFSASYAACSSGVFALGSRAGPSKDVLAMNIQLSERRRMTIITTTTSQFIFLSVIGNEVGKKKIKEVPTNQSVEIIPRGAENKPRSMDVLGNGRSQKLTWYTFSMMGIAYDTWKPSIASAVIDTKAILPFSPLRGRRRSMAATKNAKMMAFTGDLVKGLVRANTSLLGSALALAKDNVIRPGHVHVRREYHIRICM